METIISTGSAATDKMLSVLASRICHGVDGSLAICDESRAESVTASRLIVLYEGEEYLRGEAHRRLEAMMGDAYFPLSLPVSLYEAEGLLRSIAGGSAPHASRVPDAVLDLATHTVTRGSESAVLTEKESELLRLLILSAGVPTSREALRESLWRDTDGTNAPDVYVSYLRRKLTPILGDGFLANVRGKGYLLKDVVIEVR